MNTSDFDYYLPPELIAQQPLTERTSSRMMVLHRGRTGAEDGGLEHRHITDIGGYLREGDLLVLNDTRVIPARIYGYREDTRGGVEVLMIEELSPTGEWEALLRSRSRPKPGTRLVFADGAIEARITEIGVGARIKAVFHARKPLLEVMEEVGVVPVPPYIRRPEGQTALSKLDHERYQTVFGRHPGAVAAPTAGLHFSHELLESLDKLGVRRTFVTLHVGPGTFKPVKTARVEDHTMDAERYVVSETAAAEIRTCRERGGRVVAVGSTTVRTLESISAEKGRVEAGSGRSRLFIRPPFDFKVVDIMLTNFHLPKSTLLMMISAFVGQREGRDNGHGREAIMGAYREAIARQYRFFSYGDCMLLL